jgi:glucose/arabinose dehydrogenase
MPYLTAAFLILLLVAPSSALGQAGMSYQVPADNPFVGQAGAAPEIYALGLRNPYRFSFDRLTGDILIGDVGQGTREEIDWIGAPAARGANFGWACREGKIAGPRANDANYECPASGTIEPLFDYENPPSGGAAVTGGFVVRDPSLGNLVGRYLYADFFVGDVHSLALNTGNPDDQPTGLNISSPSSFGEDAAGRLYAVDLVGNGVVRLIAGSAPGTLDSQALTGPFSSPVALGTFPGDSTRLFVAERGGTVRLVVNDAARPTPFLNIAPFGITTDGERGLLSVVAAPDYAASGKVYVYYTDSGGDIRIDEFTRSASDPETADPATRRNVLVIEHSAAGNHNGGQLHFGADGCLWVTTGDGGFGDDQLNNAQNRSTLLGKLLRINPNPPGTGGPACQGVAVQPPPGGGTGADVAAPVLSARAPRRQRVARLRGTVVYVRCNESCSVGAGGILLIGRRKLLLRQVKAALVANQRARLLVRLRPRGLRSLRAALRRGGHPRVVLRLQATDSAGNRSPLVRRRVRVRR